MSDLVHADLLSVAIGVSFESLEMAMRIDCAESYSRSFHDSPGFGPSHTCILRLNSLYPGFVSYTHAPMKMARWMRILKGL